MPIRFACPRCGQKLSVSSRKAGQRADCPRCKASIEIPEAAAPVTATTSRLVAVEVPAASEQEDVAQAPAITNFAAIAAPERAESSPPDNSGHEELELVYDSPDSSPDEYSSHEDAAAQQPDWIAVPRWILYLQGGLLAVVALASFAIGLIAGSTFSGGPPRPHEPQACVIEGTIQVAAGNRRLADEGAVVAVMPLTDRRPDEKAPAIGLRPEDTTPGENQRGVAILRELGGGYARTDQHGRFQVRVPDRGKYLVLVISRAGQLKSLDAISTQDLLKLGAYFDNAADLLGRQKYELRQEVVRSDRRLNVVFE